MKEFEYIKTARSLLQPDIVALIATIHERKGRYSQIAQSANISSDTLLKLTEIAKIQSTGASNRIEGIRTTDRRLEDLVSRKAEPHGRSEQEIAGYREVLSTIHESYEFIAPTPSVILQLHRDLYSFSADGQGGKYKNSDNIIEETDSEGRHTPRFTPVSAFATAEAMDNMYRTFSDAWNDMNINRLLLTSMFILDFLCIHPFNDGNGRMSRLLTLLLLYRAGYLVGRYISVEMIIEQTKDEYYNALKISSQGWHDNQNDYTPFVRYMLSVIVKAYNELDKRINAVGSRNKSEQIKAIIDTQVGKITKKQIMQQLPGISQTTVERTLGQLLREDYIVKIGAGASTAYARRIDTNH